MIKPYIITLEQVKSYLSITDTSYDAQINLYLPIVSDDMTRKNGICNQSFLIESVAIADGTKVLTEVELSTSAWDCLYSGSAITINGIDGIIDTFDEDAETITLEAITTASGDDLELIIRDFPIGAKPTVSQMILFKFNNGSIAGATYGEEITSISTATTNVSYAGKGGALDSFGYPTALTKQLKTIRRPRFF